MLSYRRPIYVMPTSATAVTAVAEALVCNDVMIRAGQLERDSVLKATLFGKISNAVTTPGTMTYRVRWGGLAGTVLATSGALTQNVIAQTDVTWCWEMYLHCQSLGSSGTILSVGKLERSNQAAAVVADMRPDLIPASAPAAVTVDLTIDKLLSFTVEPSVATGSITCTTYVLEQLQ